MSNSIALILHLIAINIWIGGSFFATIILGRAIKHIETHQQLIVWELVLSRFFRWAWIAVFILLGSGGWMFYHLYARGLFAPLHVKLMGIIALIMVALFFFIYFVPFRQFKRVLQEEDVEACLRELSVIHVASTVNLVLGFCVVFVIAGGPYFLY